jgi:hypothetical protein
MRANCCRGVSVTLNLLTWVPEGLVLCSDSMLTLQTPAPGGFVTTTFEHAEKLIELGTSVPAAAMINGLGEIGGQLVSQLLRSASTAIDAVAAGNPVTEAVIQQQVIDAIDPTYANHAAILKANAATFWSTPERLAEVNADRAQRGLGPVEAVEPDRILIKDDPNVPNGPQDYDVVLESTLVVVVASYIAQPWAVAIHWPGARVFQAVPGSPLNWWGSGGTSVSRIVRGFDLPLMERNPGDAATQATYQYALANAVAYAMPTPVGAMPLQDAVNFTEYLGQVAVGYDKFTSGPAGVGGPLDVMLLRPGRRSWVRRKQIHSSLG